MIVVELLFRCLPSNISVTWHLIPWYLTLYCVLFPYMALSPWAAISNKKQNGGKDRLRQAPTYRLIFISLGEAGIMISSRCPTYKLSDPTPIPRNACICECVCKCMWPSICLKFQSTGKRRCSAGQGQHYLEFRKQSYLLSELHCANKIHLRSAFSST